MGRFGKSPGRFRKGERGGILARRCGLGERSSEPEVTNGSFALCCVTGSARRVEHGLCSRRETRTEPTAWRIERSTTVVLAQVLARSGYRVSGTGRSASRGER